MSRAPKGLLILRDFVEERLGPQYSLGIVPGREHYQWGRFGYHFGIGELPSWDESVIGVRNDVGSRFGYSWSAAFDLGMGWRQSRAWLSWLIQQCELGSFPDLHGVIGSLDGKTETYWHVGNGWQGEPYLAGYGDHTTHTHLEWWRDSVHRSQVSVLSSWPGWQPTPSPSVSPRGRPTKAPESPAAPRSTPPDPSQQGQGGLGSLAVLTGLAVAGLAWILRRRMLNENS
jgi:hypothetical protein